MNREEKDLLKKYFRLDSEYQSYQADLLSFASRPSSSIDAMNWVRSEMYGTSTNLKKTKNQILKIINETNNE